MGVLGRFTDKHALLLCRPNVIRRSVVKTMNLMKSGLGLFCYFDEGSDTLEYLAQ